MRTRFDKAVVPASDPEPAAIDGRALQAAFLPAAEARTARDREAHSGLLRIIDDK